MRYTIHLASCILIYLISAPLFGQIHGNLHWQLESYKFNKNHLVIGVCNGGELRYSNTKLANSTNEKHLFVLEIDESNEITSFASMPVSNSFFDFKPVVINDEIIIALNFFNQYQFQNTVFGKSNKINAGLFKYNVSNRQFNHIKNFNNQRIDIIKYENEAIFYQSFDLNINRQAIYKLDFNSTNSSLFTRLDSYNKNSEWVNDFTFSEDLILLSFSSNNGKFISAVNKNVEVWRKHIDGLAPTNEENSRAQIISSGDYIYVLFDYKGQNQIDEFELINSPAGGLAICKLNKHGKVVALSSIYRMSFKEYNHQYPSNLNLSFSNDRESVFISYTSNGPIFVGDKTYTGVNTVYLSLDSNLTNIKHFIANKTAMGVVSNDMDLIISSQSSNSYILERNVEFTSTYFYNKDVILRKTYQDLNYLPSESFQGIKLYNRPQSGNLLILHGAKLQGHGFAIIELFQRTDDSHYYSYNDAFGTYSSYSILPYSSQNQSFKTYNPIEVSGYEKNLVLYLKRITMDESIHLRQLSDYGIAFTISNDEMNQIASLLKKIEFKDSLSYLNSTLSQRLEFHKKGSFIVDSILNVINEDLSVNPSNPEINNSIISKLYNYDFASIKGKHISEILNNTDFNLISRSIKKSDTITVGNNLQITNIYYEGDSKDQIANGLGTLRFTQILKQSEQPKDLKYIGNFENGKITGNGVIIENDKDTVQTGMFENGVLIEGLKMEYHNHIISKSIEIENFHKAGLIKTYQNGKLFSLGNYDNDKISGDYITYYPNGKISLISHFENGIRDSLYLHFLYDGFVTLDDGSTTLTNGIYFNNGKSEYNIVEHNRKGWGQLYKIIRSREFKLEKALSNVKDSINYTVEYSLGNNLIQRTGNKAVITNSKDKSVLIVKLIRTPNAFRYFNSMNSEFETVNVVDYPLIPNGEFKYFKEDYLITGSYNDAGIINQNISILYNDGSSYSGNYDLSSNSFKWDKVVVYKNNNDLFYWTNEIREFYRAPFNKTIDVLSKWGDEISDALCKASGASECSVGGGVGTDRNGNVVLLDDQGNPQPKTSLVPKIDSKDMSTQEPIYPDLFINEDQYLTTNTIEIENYYFHFLTEENTLRPSGYYYSHRSNKFGFHLSQDILASPMQPVYAPIGGVVRIINKVYSENNKGLKGIEIKLSIENTVTNKIEPYLKTKIFYVNSFLTSGDIVLPGQLIGYTQDLSVKYPEVLNHVHIEAYDRYGNRIRAYQSIPKITEMYLSVYNKDK